MSKRLLIKPVGARGGRIHLLDQPLAAEEFSDYGNTLRRWELVKGSGIGSLPAYYCSDYGEVYAQFGGSDVLSPLGNQLLGDYPVVQLSLTPDIANASMSKLVHHIVAERDDFPIRISLLRYVDALDKWVINKRLQVDHLNRDVLDSSRYNLQWVTTEENQDRRKSRINMPRIQRKSLAQGEVTMAQVDTTVRFNY